jgi:hypothetical protein
VERSQTRDSVTARGGCERGSSRASRAGGGPALEGSCWLIEERRGEGERERWLRSVEAGAASGRISEGRKPLRAGIHELTRRASAVRGDSKRTYSITCCTDVYMPPATLFTRRCRPGGRDADAVDLVRVDSVRETAFSPVSRTQRRRHLTFGQAASETSKRPSDLTCW